MLNANTVISLASEWCLHSMSRPTCRLLSSPLFGSPSGPSSPCPPGSVRVPAWSARVRLLSLYTHNELTTKPSTENDTQRERERDVERVGWGMGLIQHHLVIKDQKDRVDWLCNQVFGDFYYARAILPSKIVARNMEYMPGTDRRTLPTFANLRN